MFSRDIGVGGERDVLGVCGSLLRLLACLWEKAPLELVHLVPASLVSHWDSFTGDESSVCMCVRVCVYIFVQCGSLACLLAQWWTN